LGCEQGVQRALGLPLSQMEYTWRAAYLGENRSALVFQNLSGYLLVFFVLLVVPIAPVIFSLKRKNG
jgi:hypothetical protein